MVDIYFYKKCDKRIVMEGAFVMNKKLTINTLIFSLSMLFISTQRVFAAGVAIPQSLSQEEMVPYTEIREIERLYDTYQGEVVIVEEVKILPSGAKAYYVGPVIFLGRLGWFVKYRYVGRYRDFKLIKIVNPDGSITTPTCVDNIMW